MPVPKIFIATGGGFGDFLADYFRDNKYWGYLESIKRKYPQTRIKVMASTHNTVLEQFFEGHPHVDVFENYGWRIEGWEVWNRYKGDWKYIREVNLDGLECKTPRLRLSPPETSRAENIAGRGKYIVIHPFGLRSCMPMAEWPYLCDRLIDELGYHVVVIGGNHVRLANLQCDSTVDKSRSINEEWTYNREGITNLVNNEHIRVVLKVITQAAGFIGHCSCFNMMAWLHERKSVVFSPPGQRHILTTLSRYAWPLLEGRHWCRNYWSDEWKSPRHVLDETVEFFRTT